MREHSGADSGSHPTDQARSGLGASRVDPGHNYALEYRQRKQRADQVTEICREIEERNNGN